jgi:hypothetical protein
MASNTCSSSDGANGISRSSIPVWPWNIDHQTDCETSFPSIPQPQPTACPRLAAATRPFAEDGVRATYLSCTSPLCLPPTSKYNRVQPGINPTTRTTSRPHLQRTAHLRNYVSPLYVFSPSHPVAVMLSSLELGDDIVPLLLAAIDHESTTSKELKVELWQSLPLSNCIHGSHQIIRTNAVDSHRPPTCQALCHRSRHGFQPRCLPRYPRPRLR